MSRAILRVKYSALEYSWKIILIFKKMSIII